MRSFPLLLLLLLAGCSLSPFTPYDSGSAPVTLDADATRDAGPDRSDPDAEEDAGDQDSGDEDTGGEPDADAGEGAELPIDSGEEDTGPADMGFEDATAPGNTRVRVSLIGNGRGEVNSTPSGISCPGACFADYTTGSNVTLTAQPFQGSTFSGWTGCDMVTGLDCRVAANMERTATVTFTLERYNLRIDQSGGVGTVEIPAIGATCTQVMCNYMVDYGTDLTITARSSGAIGFLHFTGASCRGGTCSFRLTRDATVGVVHSNGLVANYPLDADGTDASGHQHNATAIGMPQTRTGTVNGAVMFAAGQIFSAADQAELDGMQDLTLCTWIEPGNGSNNPQVLIEKTGAYSLTLTGMGPTRTVTGLVDANSNFTIDAPIPDDRWSHVCIVYIANVIVTDVLWIYVNGANVPPATGALAVSGNVGNSSSNLTIGGCVPGCNGPFDGALDEVKIWRRALSTGEIAAEATFPP